MTKVNRDGSRAFPDIPVLVLPAVFLHCLGFGVTGLSAEPFQGKTKLHVETTRGSFEWVN